MFIFMILRLGLNRQKWISNPMSMSSLLLRFFLLLCYYQYSLLRNENKVYHIVMQMDYFTSVKINNYRTDVNNSSGIQFGCHFAIRACTKSYESQLRHAF